MFSMRDVIIAELRRQALLQEAEDWRLFRQLPAHASGPPARVRRWLLRLADLLVHWGRCLQAQGKPNPPLPLAGDRTVGSVLEKNPEVKS